MSRAVLRYGRIAATSTVLAASAMLSAVAAEQPPADDWQFHATLYIFTADIGGTSTLPTDGGGEIDISAEQLIDHLQLAGMAAFETRKGRWGGFADVIYIDVSGSRSGTRSLATGGGIELPAGVTADLSLDAQVWVVTLAGSYSAVSTPRTSLDLLLGARLLDMAGTLDYEFNVSFGPFTGPQRVGSADSGWDGWDGIVGAKGEVRFGERRSWFVRYYLDAGTGASDSTWQGIAGGGYAFRHLELIAAYRYVDYEFEPGGKVEDLNFSGPAAGIAFRW